MHGFVQFHAHTRTHAHARTHKLKACLPSSSSSSSWICYNCSITRAWSLTQFLCVSQLCWFSASSQVWQRAYTGMKSMQSVRLASVRYFSAAPNNELRSDNARVKCYTWPQCLRRRNFVYSAPSSAYRLLTTIQRPPPPSLTSVDYRLSQEKSAIRGL